MRSCLAIIPARGGSKRIPRKNIKDFFGKPMISYSIDAAKLSGCFDEIMVSTDDREISEIAKAHGANVPFYRSERTSTDYAGLFDVIEEVLHEYKRINRVFKFICCILPTAPFISAANIRKACELLSKSNASGVISIIKYSYPIQRAFEMDGDNLKMIWPENYNMRSQDLIPAYHDAGQFYFLRTERLLKSKKIFMDNVMGIEISEIEGQDIDTEEDWKTAELKYSIIIKNRKELYG